jgi:hypothetical protein
MEEASLHSDEEVKKALITQISKGTKMSIDRSTQLLSIPVGSDRASQEVTSGGGTDKRQTSSQNMLAAAPLPLPRQIKSSDAGPLPIRPPSSDSLDGEESQTSPGIIATGKACGLPPTKKSIPKKDRSKFRKGKWTVRIYFDVSIYVSIVFILFSNPALLYCIG